VIRVDPARLARALELDVATLGDGSSVVTGGAEPHVVEGQECDCADSRFHDGPCKHRLAVYLHRTLYPAVLEALRLALSPETQAVAP
jgi:hypothetical protein